MEDGRQPCGSLWNSFGEINNKGGKMVETMTQEIEEEIYEIEDTIRKLLP